MEKRVKKDKVCFRQVEYQLLRLGIVLTANDRKPNHPWFLEIECVFFSTEQKI